MHVRKNSLLHIRLVMNIDLEKSEVSYFDFLNFFLKKIITKTKTIIKIKIMFVPIITMLSMLWTEPKKLPTR